MKCIFAQFEHSCLGFPGVKLKWAEEDGRWTPPYVTINGVICKQFGYRWHNPHPEAWTNFEMDKFDEWVRKHFVDNSTVQG